jgi:D-arabinose 1-dehydrogenase-like Zn-dependent alcohol dehydrogenase
MKTTVLIGSHWDFASGRRMHGSEVPGWARKKQVKPRIETYPLDQANEVRERLAAGKVRYRAVYV